ncbi:MULTISPECIES: cobalamin biosynthesis protein [unclassified Pseudomonas]|uniref:cobalamin biosynthesis protein n=1 Tax=unclassified Pseudomonas TaxID=196821 RepID=UPI00131E5BBD|nr:MULTISPECIES: cobalamin biosynthesis protein [unclassified Pseudomonas]
MALVLGLGCRRDCSVEELAELAQEVLQEAGCDPSGLTALATVDRRLQESGLQSLAQRWRLPLHGFSAERLAQQQGVASPSPVALQHTGSPSVAEAAALAAAGEGARLLVSKRKSAAATAALAYA